MDGALSARALGASLDDAFQNLLDHGYAETSAALVAQACYPPSHLLADPGAVAYAAEVAREHVPSGNLSLTGASRLFAMVAGRMLAEGATQGSGDGLLTMFTWIIDVLWEGSAKPVPPLEESNEAEDGTQLREALRNADQVRLLRKERAAARRSATIARKELQRAFDELTARHELLEEYREQLEEKDIVIEALEARLADGTDALKTARREIAELREELAASHATLWEIAGEVDGPLLDRQAEGSKARRHESSAAVNDDAHAASDPVHSVDVPDATAPVESPGLATGALLLSLEAVPDCLPIIIQGATVAILEQHVSKKGNLSYFLLEDGIVQTRGVPIDGPVAQLPGTVRVGPAMVPLELDEARLEQGGRPSAFASGSARIAGFPFRVSVRVTERRDGRLNVAANVRAGSKNGDLLRGNPSAPSGAGVADGEDASSAQLLSFLDDGVGLL